MAGSMVTCRQPWCWRRSWGRRSENDTRPSLSIWDLKVHPLLTHLLQHTSSNKNTPPTSATPYKRMWPFSFRPPQILCFSTPSSLLCLPPPKAMLHYNQSQNFHSLYFPSWPWLCCNPTPLIYTVPLYLLIYGGPMCVGRGVFFRVTH